MISRQRIYIFTVLLLFFTTNVIGRNVVEPNLLKNVDKAKMKHWVDSVYNSMSLDERIGQLIVLHLSGSDTESNRAQITRWVRNTNAGGILFLKGTPVGQAGLTNLAQSNSRVPLLVTADAEWGLSMRLSNTTRFPKNMMLGAIRDESLIYKYGEEMARQCKVMGIQVNFAPVADVNSNSENPVIGIRSFGENIKRVSELGVAYGKGLESGGVLSVAKHFPGHGDTSTDSHKTLPLIEHDKDRLNDVELIPFRDYIDAGLGGMMIAHLSIPSLDDSGMPSSLSKSVTTDLLQTELGFRGLIFTDGLAMQGVASEKDMSVRAVLAGNDILLGPINPEKEFQALKEAVANNALSESIVNERCRKILEYKYLLGLNKYSPIDVKNVGRDLNTSEAEWLCRKLNEKAMTLLKNEDDIVPVRKLQNRKIAVVSLGASAGNSFQRIARKYADVAYFTASNAADVARIKAQLVKYNTVIVSVHSVKAFSDTSLNSLIEGKESVVAFMVSPYQIKKFAPSLKKADAVLMAYEDTQFAREYAAQAIFGGNAISGKLPVTVQGLYKEGKGLSTEKSRLAYNLPEEVGIESSRLDRIEDIVKEGIEARGYPGCQILVAKDGVVIYDRAFGTFEYNKAREVTTDDIYDLASMTKASATIPAIMKLYDEKKLALQNPLSKYIPQLKNTDKSDITVRQALFHETGLPSFIQYYLPAIDQNSYAGRLISYRQADGYPALIDNGAWARSDFKYKADLISPTSKPGFTRKVADGLFVSDAYNDTIVQRIADSKLRARKSYLYSCLNFMLLKEVVEDVSHEDLNTFLQKNFYTRLGAYTTTYNPLEKFEKDMIAPTEKDDFLRKQLLQGYVHDEGAAFLGGISGNAGLFSNANDLAKLFQMWLNKGEYGGERYLSEATVRMFTSTKSPNSRRGLGFDKPDMRSTKASPTSPQAPQSVYGHTGFTGTCFWIDPDSDLIYIFLANRVNPSRTHKELMKLNIRTRIQEIIYNAIK